MLNSFNSKQYSWSDVNIAIKGNVLMGVTAFSSSVKRKRERLYGRGSKAFEILDGNLEAEGEISLWQSDLEHLIKRAPKRDLTLMKFDIVVCYAKVEGGMLTTDIWKGFCPTESVKTLKQGDTKMEVKVPGIILDVKYNVK